MMLAPAISREKLANIGLRVGKVLNRFKMAKHFRLEITDNSFHYQRDTANIAAEAAIDGIYVIRTSVSHKLFEAGETVRAYQSLSTVEQAFRSYKTVDVTNRRSRRSRHSRRGEFNMARA